MLQCPTQPEQPEQPELNQLFAFADLIASERHKREQLKENRIAVNTQVVYFAYTWLPSNDYTASHDALKLLRQGIQRGLVSTQFRTG